MCEIHVFTLSFEPLQADDDGGDDIGEYDNGAGDAWLGGKPSFIRICW